MYVKAVFIKDGKKLGEFPILVVGEGDLSNGAKEAYKQFRNVHPLISLFDVTVSFEKLDESYP